MDSPSSHSSHKIKYAFKDHEYCFNDFINDSDQVSAQFVGLHRWILTH